MKVMKVFELLPQLFTQSELMILDFNQIPSDLPEFKNIKSFFEKSQSRGIDPKLPINRQRFNNNFLEKSGKRYLISRYVEDRIEMLKGSQIAKEGRTIHLGIDIFSKNLETIYSPCDGEIIIIDKETEDHSFGNYLFFKPDPSVTKNFIFLGHLSNKLPHLGKVTRGEIVAQFGDYIDGENGGWSRHVHIQLFESLPKNKAFIPGYATKETLEKCFIKYPDPSFLIFK